MRWVWTGLIVRLNKAGVLSTLDIAQITRQSLQGVCMGFSLSRDPHTGYYTQINRLINTRDYRTPQEGGLSINNSLIHVETFPESFIKLTGVTLLGGGRDSVYKS